MSAAKSAIIPKLNFCVRIPGSRMLADRLAHKPPRSTLPAAGRPRRSAAFAQKNVVRGIGDTTQRAGLVAGAVQDAAGGIDPLNDVDVGEQPPAAPARDLELEPGNIVRGCARTAGKKLAGDRAAAHVFPGRAGIVTPDGLAIEYQRRDRLTENPCQLAVGCGLAFVK